jgi:hypothetical protein
MVCGPGSVLVFSRWGRRTGGKIHSGRTARANQWFDEPDGVSMPTGDVFSNSEVRDDEELYISELDIATSFYMLEIPEPLRDLFCLRPLCASALGSETVGDVKVHKSTLIYPHLTVVPMGWTHALAWCQRLH